MKTWTLTLVIVTFLLTLFGTFLTRSGVFNSVHSFTQSEIGPVFLVFIGVVLIFGLVLLSTRDHVLEASDEANVVAGTGMNPTMRYFRKRMGPMHPLGREFAVFLQNLVFAVFTFTVLLGTVFPLLTEAFEERRISVGEPYFDRMALPLGLLLVVLMGIGPVVPWGRMSTAVVLGRFVPPLIGGAVTAAIFALAGFHGVYTVFALFLCGFALVANLGEFTSPVFVRMRAQNESAMVASERVFRRARRRYGGHLAHLGVILAVFAMALGKGYKHELDFTLRPGETASIDGWDATFTGARMDRFPSRDSLVASFVVHRDGREIGVFEPKLNYFARQREPVGTPAIHTTWREDLYFSLVQVEPTGAYASVRLMVMPGVLWLWVAAPFFLAAALVILWPDRPREPAAAPVREGEPA